MKLTEEEISKLHDDYANSRKIFPVDPEQEKLLNSLDKDKLYDEIKYRFHTEIAPSCISVPFTNSPEQRDKDLYELEKAWKMFVNMVCLDGDISEYHRVILFSEDTPTTLG